MMLVSRFVEQKL